MADGDAASAIGLAILTGIEKVKDMFKQINATRDMLANHITSGTHAASQITSGILALARIPAIPSLTSVDGLGTLIWDGAAWIGTGNLGVYGFAVIHGNLTADASIKTPYGRAHGISGGLTAYIGTDGTIAVSSSARRFKTNIEPADLVRSQFQQLGVFWFQYIDALERGEAERELFIMADDADALGLDWLVVYDADGRPFSINERRFQGALFWLAQDAHSRLDELTRTVYDLKADLLKMQKEGA